MRLVIAFIGLLTTAAGSPFALASSPQDDLFTAIYNRSILKQRSIRSIRARFTETTTSALLVAPIVAHGTVTAAPPGRVRMTYDRPEAKTITMDGSTLIVTWAGRPDREQIDIRAVQARVDHYFRDASVSELRSMFDIVAGPDVSARHADRVEMTPKQKTIKAGLEKLELWIDRDADMLTQLRLTFPGGEQKTIALEDVELNVPVDDSLFRGRP